MSYAFGISASEKRTAENRKVTRSSAQRTQSFETHLCGTLRFPLRSLRLTNRKVPQSTAQRNAKFQNTSLRNFAISFAELCGLKSGFKKAGFNCVTPIKFIAKTLFVPSGQQKSSLRSLRLCEKQQDFFKSAFTFRHFSDIFYCFPVGSVFKSDGHVYQ